MADVVVLRGKIHGMDPEGYAAALRERLDREVALARTPAEERALLTGPDGAAVATGYALDEDLVAAARNLRLFACTFAGTGHLPLSAFEAAEVAVTSAAGVHVPNVPEHALGGMLAFARGFDRAWRRKERREWRSFQSRELAGSTVAVIGMGAIGTGVVERLGPFGVHTVGVRYTPGKGGPTDEVHGFDAVHEAVADADFLVVAAPLSETTRGLVDADLLRTLPAEAVLVNVGRGAIVDTDALLEALRWNRIRGAALDVTDPEPLPPEHPLWRFDNVLITPHSAGHTPAYWERLADLLARNVDRLDDSEDVENRVV